MELSRIVGIVILVSLVVVLSVCATIWRRKLKRDEARRWNRTEQSIDSTDK